MGVPKYKASKSRTRRKRSINSFLEAPKLVGCSNCGNKILRHRACPKCGMYRGKEVFKPEEMA